MRLQRSQYEHLTSSLGSISREGLRCDDVLCHNRVGVTYLKNNNRCLAAGDDIWVSLAQSMQRLSLMCAVFFSTSLFCCFLFHLSMAAFPPGPHQSPADVLISVFFPHTLAQANTLKLLQVAQRVVFLADSYLLVLTLALTAMVSGPPVTHYNMLMWKVHFLQHRQSPEEIGCNAIQRRLVVKLVPFILSLLRAPLQSRAILPLLHYITAANKEKS